MSDSKDHPGFGHESYDIVVPKVKAQEDHKSFRGQQIFDFRWFNVYLCARRHSGKTVLIYNLFRWFLNPNSRVFFFVGTWLQDDMYAEIRKLLKKKKVPFEGWTSTIGEHGEDRIRGLMHAMDEEQKEWERENGGDSSLQSSVPMSAARPSRREDHNGLVLFGPPPPTVQVSGEDPNAPNQWLTNQQYYASGMYGAPLHKYYEAKNKKKAPKKKKKMVETWFVFDDLGDELRKQIIVELSKRSRHFKSKVIISSQNLYDLHGQTINQMNYVIVFKDMPEDRLEEIRRKLGDFRIPIEELVKLYRKCTEKDYSFMMMDAENQQIRCGHKQVVYDAQRDFSKFQTDTSDSEFTSLEESSIGSSPVSQPARKARRVGGGGGGGGKKKTVKKTQPVRKRRKKANTE